jgi:hypothetical protein
MPAVFTYGTDLDVFSVEADGTLTTRYYNQFGWNKLDLGAGCKPGAVPKVLRDYGGVAGRLDVFAEAPSGIGHAWFDGSWSFEILT